MEGGCDDVGIGVLFGLYDWRFEVLGLVAHAVHLRERYGVGPIRSASRVSGPPAALNSPASVQ